MGIFRKKKPDTAAFHFDRTLHRPVIYSSICTGEKRAGFEWIENGRFEEVMCIRSPQDMKSFLEAYGVEEKEIVVKY